MDRALQAFSCRGSIVEEHKMPAGFCVMQGEITVDNYKTRVLTTYVICLPNDVSIEFIPAEE